MSLKAVRILMENGLRTTSSNCWEGWFLVWVNLFQGNLTTSIITKVLSHSCFRRHLTLFPWLIHLSLLHSFISSSSLCFIASFFFLLIPEVWSEGRVRRYSSLGADTVDVLFWKSFGSSLCQQQPSWWCWQSKLVSSTTTESTAAANSSQGLHQQPDQVMNHPSGWKSSHSSPINLKLLLLHLSSSVPLHIPVPPQAFLKFFSLWQRVGDFNFGCLQVIHLQLYICRDRSRKRCVRNLRWKTKTLYTSTERKQSKRICLNSRTKYITMSLNHESESWSEWTQYRFIISHHSIHLVFLPYHLSISS